MSLAVAEPCVQHGTRRPSAAPRLLVELRERAGAEPRGAVEATVAELAAALRVSRRTVQRAAADLVATGLIDVAESPGRYTPNTYTVTSG